MFVSAIGIIMHWIDILMLGIFSDANAVGMYHPIERTAGLIRMILFAFAGIFAPLFSQYFYQDNSEKMKEIYQLSTKWIFVASLPLFIFLMLFSNPMLMLFGSEFDNGLALKILTAGIMVQAFFGLGSSSLTMSGFSNLNLLNVLVALAVNIIMNIILIPDYGNDELDFEIEFLNKKRNFFLYTNIGYLVEQNSTIINISPLFNYKNFKFF